MSERQKQQRRERIEAKQASKYKYCAVEIKPGHVRLVPKPSWQQRS